MNGPEIALLPPGESKRLTYRIQLLRKADAIVFALSGEMDKEHAARVQELLGTEERGRIFLDLKEITLVDRAAMQFLARVEAEGVRILNCPDYVRSWIVAENAGTQPD